MATDTLPPKVASRSSQKRTSESVRRRVVFAALAFVALLVAGYLAFAWLTFPSDRTPEGAYYRVATGVNRGAPELIFPYIETAAQHASYTILEFRKKSRALVLASYPEPERSRLAAEHAAIAAAPDGSDVFALYARQRGWLRDLRRDLSGVEKVEVHGERATVQTVRGTRYSFRRRENGIWGLTLFTPILTADAEKAARDHQMIRAASDDYERAHTRGAE